jgi:FkbM family methyltransferase
MRPFAWRLGRFLYRWGRREGANRPRTNGEYWLVEQMVSRSQGDPLVLLDIGANKGEWSAGALRALGRHRKGGDIHAFDPAAATFEYLSRRFQDEESVTPHHLGLSDRSGQAGLHVLGPLAGRSSLHPAAGSSPETVRLRSLDELVAQLGIRHISMVKSDTEGHDLTVLKGARESLRAGRVDIWQFEYNHRWLLNNASLMAVFELIEELPYRLGKLYGNGIELYDEWHFELDRYIETNYVLLRIGSGYEELGTAMRFDRFNVARRAT